MEYQLVNGASQQCFINSQLLVTQKYPMLKAELTKHMAPASS
jgi:hypothetical protein